MKNQLKNSSKKKDVFFESSELYKLCIQGDSLGWQYLYKMIEPLFISMLSSSGNPLKYDVSDVIQNFLIDLSTKKIYKVDKINAFKGFVLKCARHYILDQFKTKTYKEKRRTKKIDDLEVNSAEVRSVSFEKELIFNVTLNYVLDKIEIKYPKDFKILSLYLKGKAFSSQRLSTDEIAKKLDIAKGSVGTKIMRGLEKIRKDPDIKNLFL